MSLSPVLLEALAAWDRMGAKVEPRPGLADGTLECPLCEGEGALDGAIYDGNDGAVNQDLFRASTIGAYGIGDGLEDAQKVVAALPELMALVRAAAKG